MIGYWAYFILAPIFMGLVFGIETGLGVLIGFVLIKGIEWLIEIGTA